MGKCKNIYCITMRTSVWIPIIHILKNCMAMCVWNPSVGRWGVERQRIVGTWWLLAYEKINTNSWFIGGSCLRGI